MFLENLGALFLVMRGRCAFLNTCKLLWQSEGHYQVLTHQHIGVIHSSIHACIGVYTII